MNIHPHLTIHHTKVVDQLHQSIGCNKYTIVNKKGWVHKNTHPLFFNFVVYVHSTIQHLYTVLMCLMCWITFYIVQ